MYLSDNPSFLGSSHKILESKVMKGLSSQLWRSWGNAGLISCQAQFIFPGFRNLFLGQLCKSHKSRAKNGAFLPLKQLPFQLLVRIYCRHGRFLQKEICYVHRCWHVIGSPPCLIPKSWNCKIDFDVGVFDGPSRWESFGAEQTHQSSIQNHHGPMACLNGNVQKVHVAKISPKSQSLKNSIHQYSSNPSLPRNHHDQKSFICPWIFSGWADHLLACTV